MEEQSERALTSSGQNTTELEENGKSRCSHAVTIARKHRMVWVGRDLKAHPVPTVCDVCVFTTL